MPYLVCHHKERTHTVVHRKRVLNRIHEPRTESIIEGWISEDILSLTIYNFNVIDKKKMAGTCSTYETCLLHTNVGPKI